MAVDDRALPLATLAGAAVGAVFCRYRARPDRATCACGTAAEFVHRRRDQCADRSAGRTGHGVLRFRGRAMADALIDMPLALAGTIVSVTWTALFTPGRGIGAMSVPSGTHLAYGRLAVSMAVMSVGLALAARIVEPVSRDRPIRVGKAARSTGCARIQTIGRVVLPALPPARRTGFGAAFARPGRRTGLGCPRRRTHADDGRDRTAVDPNRLEQCDHAGVAPGRTVPPSSCGLAIRDRPPQASRRLTVAASASWKYHGSHDLSGNHVGCA